MNSVYIGLGSNLGNREKNIDLALDHLQQHDQIELDQLSNQYETTAISNYTQPKFINCVAKLSTFLSPEELLSVTESIEIALGRNTKGLGDPRPIDLDILFYNDIILSTDHLIIPHPLAHERMFVLDPMNDLAPDFIHPLLNISISELHREKNGY